MPGGNANRLTCGSEDQRLAMFKRSLIFIHRWLGVALCLLFLLWFPSGIGMMYFPMPSVTPAARLERLPVLDAVEGDRAARRSGGQAGSGRSTISA